MAKIAYKDSKIADKSIEAGLRVSLTDSQARTAQLHRSISEFVAKVESVTFNVNEADAEPWMSQWRARLHSGNINATDM